MTIRSKLAWTFILLLIFGITAITSYSIVFIRDYLLDEGIRQIYRDSRWLALTIEKLPSDKQFPNHFNEIAKTSGYQLALYDAKGALLGFYPDSAKASPYLSGDLLVSLNARGKLPVIKDETESELVLSYIYLPDSINETRYIKVSQLKDHIFAPIKTIRWIIYYGMFISIGIVIGVSIWVARYITKPITQIKNAAGEIAEGDVDRQIDLNRNDEFGTLATSLNRMASRLRADTEQIMRFADKQRQFFADITHEIRNPLHTISGALEMLELENLPADKQQTYLKTAQKQTVRISRLFKDLVTLQRYDSDEYFIEKKEFDLALIAKHMVEWYGERVEEKGITLEVDTHTCLAIGDPGKIEQVVDNLISNAVKYTNSGNISLRYFRTNGEVTLEVRDTGIGISDEHLNRLFDRFYRTDKARSRDKGGTGLGLAVVKSILNAHGTDIEVESEVGKGSAFWFNLRAA